MTKDSSRRHFSLKILTSPWSILAGVVAGIYIGLYYKDIVEYIAPVGHIYLAVLKMCILPILLCAITISLGGLIRSESASKYVGSMVMIFIISWLSISAFGVAISTIAKPGEDLGGEALATLGTIVRQSGSSVDLEMKLYGENVVAPELPPMRKFLNELVPENIFSALSMGQNLKVLFFAIIFGIAAGFVPQSQADFIFTSLSAVYKCFEKLVAWLIYPLPFALCALVAEQLSQLGLHIFLAMGKFAVLTVISFVLLYLPSLLLIWLRSGASFSRTMSAFKEPIIIALATRNSLAAVPSTLTAMIDVLRLDRQMVGFVVPLSITICRYGSLLYFAIATIFISQLYNVDLTGQQIIIVILASILAGMASAGSTGVASLTMMSLVLDPLGLPLDAVLVLLIVIDPLTAPLRALGNLLPSCAGAALLAKREEDMSRVGKEALPGAVA